LRLLAALNTADTQILKSGQGEVFSNPITSANLICCCTRGKVANTALIAYENCLAAIKLCPPRKSGWEKRWEKRISVPPSLYFPAEPEGGIIKWSREKAREREGKRKLERGLAKV